MSFGRGFGRVHRFGRDEDRLSRYRQRHADRAAARADGAWRLLPGSGRARPRPSRDRRRSARPRGVRRRNGAAPTVERMAADVAELAAALDLQGAIGVGCRSAPPSSGTSSFRPRRRALRRGGGGRHDRSGEERRAMGFGASPEACEARGRRSARISKASRAMPARRSSPSRSRRSIAPWPNGRASNSPATMPARSARSGPAWSARRARAARADPASDPERPRRQERALRRGHRRSSGRRAPPRPRRPLRRLRPRPAPRRARIVQRHHPRFRGAPVARRFSCRISRRSPMTKTLTSLKLGTALARWPPSPRCLWRRTNPFRSPRLDQAYPEAAVRRTRPMSSSRPGAARRI